MSKKHLTEGTIRAVAALHARVFVVCRAATNEAFFTPRFVSHDLRSNCPSLLVKLDYPSAHCRTTPFTRHFYRAAVRLPDFSGRMGDTRDQRHYPTTSLDNLLQAAGARQPEDAASGASLVRVGSRDAARGNTQSGDRRHADSASVQNSAGQCHSARPCQKNQSNTIRTGAMLGDLGHQRSGWCGSEVCTADSVPFSARHWQSEQADHCVVPGARPGSGDEGQACPDTVRRLVYAGATGVAAAISKDESDRSSAARHCAISAARLIEKTWARTAKKIRRKNDTGSDPGFASIRSKIDVVWQGTVDTPALSDGDGTLSQRHVGTRSMVRILRCGQAELVKGATVVGDRNGAECRGNLAPVCPSLGYRTVVPQPETLVGRQQSVAAKTHRTGTVDADSIHRMDTGSATEFGGGRKLPYRCRRPLARQATADRRFGGAVAAHGIYRTCVSGRFQPEVRDIHLSGTARRPKIASVVPPSAALSMRFNRFGLNCVTAPVTQG
ncbi:hypothetical protein FERRO_14320 [Ferrovum sp. JA12]|nr:hypothetical protein FERRO_14320 [Ferrovum sp. JA12]